MMCRSYARTWTSKVKYFLRFLMTMTRKGSLMPSVALGSAGQVMKVVLRVSGEWRGRQRDTVRKEPTKKNEGERA